MTVCMGGAQGRQTKHFIKCSLNPIQILALLHFDNNLPILHNCCPALMIDEVSRLNGRSGEGVRAFARWLTTH